MMRRFNSSFDSPAPLRREPIIVLNPFGHLRLRRIVLRHQLLQFRFRRGIRIRDRNRDVSVLLDDVAGRQRLIR